MQTQTNTQTEYITTPELADPAQFCQPATAYTVGFEHALYAQIYHNEHVGHEWAQYDAGHADGMSQRGGMCSWRA